MVFQYKKRNNSMVTIYKCSDLRMPDIKALERKMLLYSINYPTPATRPIVSKMHVLIGGVSIGTIIVFP